MQCFELILPAKSDLLFANQPTKTRRIHLVDMMFPPLVIPWITIFMSSFRIHDLYENLQRTRRFRRVSGHSFFFSE